MKEIDKYFNQFADFLKDYSQTKNVNITNLLEMVRWKKDTVIYSGDIHFELTYKIGNNCFFGWLMRYATMLHDKKKIPDYIIFLNPDTSAIICLKMEEFIRHICRVVGIVKKDPSNRNSELLYKKGYLERIADSGWEKIEKKSEELFEIKGAELQKAGMVHFVINPTSFNLDPFTAGNISSSIQIIESLGDKEVKKKRGRPRKEDFVHLHNHSQYCISWDSVIYKALKHHERGQCYRNDYTRKKGCKTIKEIHDGWHTGRFNRYSVKVFDGEKFVPSKIKNIVYSGIKDVYRVTTETGKEIKATLLHKFFDLHGPKRLGDFKVGDLIACNGVPCYQSKEWLEEKYINKGLNQQQIADICKIHRGTIKTYVKKFGLHKDKSEWMKGHKISDECRKNLSLSWIPRLKNLSEPKSVSGYRFRSQKKRLEVSELSGDTDNLVIHHIDGDPCNNSDINLLTVTNKEHGQIHAAQPYTAVYERIVSIERVGLEETYDLEVNHSAHNFVANSFITHNSLLDGVPTLDKIAEKAHSLGQPGVAITDHGYMHGNYKLQQACNKYGIKAVHGVEAYYVDDQKDKSKRFYYHMTILAINKTGWSNMVKLITDAGKYGFYYKPRIDWNSLCKYNEGLIILSGCYKSVVSYHFTEEGRDLDKAVENMRRLKSVFGDRFYNEVMNIDFPEYDDIVPEMIGVANDEGVKNICTNDCHYVDKEDATIQSTMLRIQTGGKGLEFSSDSFYLKSKKEMITGPITKQMASMTMEVLDRVDFKLEFEGYKFPNFDIKKTDDYKEFKQWNKELTCKRREQKRKEKEDQEMNKKQGASYGG